MSQKIVIVDDEVHIRALIEQTLEDLEDDHDVEETLVVRHEDVSSMAIEPRLGSPLQPDAAEPQHEPRPHASRHQVPLAARRNPSDQDTYGAHGDRAEEQRKAHADRSSDHREAVGEAAG